MSATALCIHAGCAPVPDTDTPKVHTALPEVQAELDLQAPALEPLVAAFFSDQSGSMVHHRVQPPTEEDLKPVLTYIQHHGGELAIAPICSQSNIPLKRVRVTPPPRLNSAQFHNPAPPESLKETEANPFLLEDKLRAYQPEYEKLKASDLQTLATYRHQHQIWQKQSEAALGAFQGQLKSLLAQPGNCAETDITGALKRANLFLSEDASVWPKSPRRFVLFVTDGLDTQSTETVFLQRDAELLLINGSGSTGVFSHLDHKPFESVRAAIDYLIVKTQGGLPDEK